MKSLLSTIIIAAAAAFQPLLAGDTLSPYLDGSLDPAVRADDLLGRLTVQEKMSLMMDRSPAIPRLGIPAYNWWNEALHGVGRAGLATVLPQAIAMAATWDDAAVNRAFSMISDEARAKFNDFRRRGEIKRYQGLTFWTPNINIFRDPRWGRGQETYGEDPYLTTMMGLAAVDGLQGRDPRWMKTIACAKHFAVHSGPEWNRHSFDARDILPFDLWATYLPAFRKLVDANVGQVMCAYNRFEGEPCCSSKKLLVDILRNRWGYDKIIVSDCSAIRDFIVDWGHNTHPSGAHAGADAVISGTDLECGSIYKDLPQALAQGLIDEKHIDTALRRLLTARFELGELFSPGTPWDSLPLDIVGSRPHADIALDIARKSIVLLKNNGILPLDPAAPARILVAGPNAADSVMQWGNYSGTPGHTVTLLDGVRAFAPGADWQHGCNHVVGDNAVSRFDLFDGGLHASFWNSLQPQGAPVADALFTSPLALSTGGATVFAPGVNLNDFSARFKGRFVPDADAPYVISIEASKGEQCLVVDGDTVAFRQAGGRQDHKLSYLIDGHKGKAVDIDLFFNHADDVADLRFDITTTVDTPFDASAADVVIFAAGISPKLEGEEMKVSVPGFRGGDRETIELPAVQRRLIRRLKDAGKKIILVNYSGSAMGLAPEDSICDAIIQAWYPGQEGGTAVAEVIFGAYNPAGRLPVTFYTGDAQLPDFEDYSMEGRTYRFMTERPLYAFGHGLSYTTFSYNGASVDKPAARVGDTVRLSVDLANTGSRDGDEVVQVYISRHGDPTGTTKSLRAFRRVPLRAGQSTTVSFDLDPEAFATFDTATQSMTTLPGRYTIHYGGSSDRTDTVEIDLVPAVTR